MSEKPITIEVWPMTKLMWNDELNLEVVEVGPPTGGSFIDLPGPKRLPTRPYLEPFAGPCGVAARVLWGDGQVMPLVVLVDKTETVRSISELPLALSAGSDGGVWVLTRKRLEYFDADGTQVHALNITGITLVGVDSGAVWVVGFDTAWFVDGDGRIRAHYPWNAGIGSVGSGSTLCALDKGEPRRIRCLEPTGEERFLTLPSPPSPFEQLLAFTRHEIITKSGSIFRSYGPDGILSEMTVHAAGLTAAGDAFVSGRSGSSIDLWVAKGRAQQLPLPPDAPVHGALRVVSVEGRRSLVYGLDFAAWYESGSVENTFVVDEQNFRNDVFPYMWDIGTSRYAAASPDGMVILSTTGPAGASLIAMRVYPKKIRTLTWW